MASILTEGSSIESSTEQKDLCEYVVPFTPEDEELVHNLEVLRNISSSATTSEDGVLEGVRIGRESYSIKPTEVYAINNEGGKVFVTGKLGSANRMVFYAYPNSPQEPLEGIDASPYLRVYNVELIMTRRTTKGEVKSNFKNFLEVTHSYPQINTDILFIDRCYGDFPDIFFLNPAGMADTVRRKGDHLRFVKYGYHPVAAIGRRNREKFYGDRMAYERLLKSIWEHSNPYGGLQPKDAYLQLALTKDDGYESNFVISI